MKPHRTVDLITIPSMVVPRLAALGLDVPGLLRRAGLPATAFGQGKARVSTRQFFALWDAVAQMLPEPSLGLRIGAQAAAEQLDVTLIAALHSAHLGDALQKMARYKRLTCPEVLDVEHRDGEARLHLHWLLAETAPPPLLTDALFASIVEVVRRGTGQRTLGPRRIELARRADHEALLTRHFGCPVHFDAPVDRLVFDEALLHVPFVTHNEDLLALMVPGLETRLQEQGAAAMALESQVRRILGRGMRGQRPSVEWVARELCLSPRTLQRRLEESGTSYQRLLDATRQQTARHMLQATELDTGEIAFFLGFEEINSFTRAFQAWEGTTPSRWRAALAKKKGRQSPWDGRKLLST